MCKNEVVITSLSEYINAIENSSKQEYYRGESKEHPSQHASAFRPYTGTWKSKGIFPFVQMIDEFYKEIAYKLSEDKADFIAFAQHHGIPTNLLDISASPLISLYFACENNMDDDGMVYIVDDICIDVTELVHHFPNKNLIDEVFSNTPKELNLLMPLFESFCCGHPDEFDTLLDELISDYLEYFSHPFDEKEEQVQASLKAENYDVYEVISLLREYDEELKSFSWEKEEAKVYLYLCLMYTYFKHAKDYCEVIMRIDFLPNMIYRPIIKFERGRNQQGLFLYQGYMSYIEPVYDFHVLAVQEPKFKEKVFRIKNKREILKALDKIGINRKTIFCDYDNVARYIKDKYDVTKEK